MRSTNRYKRERISRWKFAGPSCYGPPYRVSLRMDLTKVGMEGHSDDWLEMRCMFVQAAGEVQCLQFMS